MERTMETKTKRSMAKIDGEDLKAQITKADGSPTKIVSAMHIFPFNHRIMESFSFLSVIDKYSLYWGHN